MSTTDTAPDCPETADSDLEWDCLEWEEELLIAEIEEFLATIPTPRSTRTRTTELTTAGRRPAHDADAETVPPSARRAPARHSGATQRSPPLQQQKAARANTAVLHEGPVMPTINNLHSSPGTYPATRHRPLPRSAHGS